MIKIKGAFIKDDEDLVRKMAGEEGVAKFHKLYGKPFIFSSLKNYPIEDELEVIRAASLTILGKEDWYEMGKLEFGVFMSSPVGQMCIKLFGYEIGQFIKNLNRIFEAIYVGGFEIKAQESEEEIKIKIDPDPYPIEYYQGVFDRALEDLNPGLKAEIQDLGNRTHEYTIKLKPSSET